MTTLTGRMPLNVTDIVKNTTCRLLHPDKKYNVYSSVGYLNEKGYVKATGYERFSGRINTTYTPNKWFKGGVNLTGSWTKRNYNSNASGNAYANPFYIARYMAPVYPVYLHNADGTYQLDAAGDKIYDTTSLI